MVFNPCPWFLLRKEVIQPQVPLRLPCYDFIPITSHTFGTCLLAVNTATSGTTGFHDVTGGVYKAWERIHGAVADAPLLAIPASCRRVADDNLNWARFLRICHPFRLLLLACQGQVRFFALHRIKPHTPPLVQAPVNFFEF